MAKQVLNVGSAPDDGTGDTVRAGAIKTNENFTELYDDDVVTAAHIASTANPHSVTKTQVSLGNVDNTSNATERATTATLTNKTLTAPVVNSPTGIVKADVGLSNVDNTADSAKPVSSAQLTALNLKENSANKGAASGYASLGSDSKVPTAQLPALAITDTFVVSSQSAQTGLTAEVGDICIRTDESKSYILKTDPASTFGNWSELLTPTDTVLSVNSLTGAVTLTTANIADSANKRYVTDANLTVIGNTSGTNTGDNAGVTTVTGTTPIVSSGGNTPAISISAATTSAAGSLSAADKVKINALTGSEVTSVTGTAPVVSSGGATPAISMAAATASVNGYATSTQITKLDGIATAATANGTVTGSGTTSGSNTGDQTNITGNAATVTTNANLTGHVTSVGNAVVLGSFSSAQLKAALSDETGSGVAVFGTSPTFTGTVNAAALNTSGAVVFNDAGADVDFRVEGDTNANLLVVDASADAVGIGTDAPETYLHVFKDSSGASTDGSAVAHFESSGSTVLQVSAGTSNDCHIAFGDSGNQNIGSIAYLNNGNHMVFRADNGEKMRLTSGGDLTLSSGAVNATVHTEAAHATTSDIWTGGNTCLLSGSAVTFTDVADAPQAGAVRYVVANAAHVFTDNTALEVDGNENYTCAANDVLMITAKSTSTFRVNILAHGDSASGGGSAANEGFTVNINAVAADYTLATNSNASSVGPMTVNTGVTVTIPTGSRWVIL